MSEKKTKKTPYRLEYNQYGTAEELLAKLKPLVVGPLQTAQECEGDMWLSDWRELHKAFHLLNNMED